MSFTWSSIDPNPDISLETSSEHQVSIFRSKYDHAIHHSNTRMDLFTQIVCGIESHWPKSSELGLIRFLALKNQSKHSAENRNYQEALDFNLQAQEMDNTDVSLIFQACELFMRLGNNWSPRYFLFLCRPFQSGVLLQSSISKLKNLCTDLFSNRMAEGPFNLEVKMPSSLLASFLNRISIASPRIIDDTPIIQHKSQLSNIITPLLSSRVSIFWKDDNLWYEGVIKSFNKTSQRHTVLYDDGVLEDVFLPDEEYKVLVSTDLSTNNNDQTFASTLDPDDQPIPSSSKDTLQLEEMESSANPLSLGQELDEVVCCIPSCPSKRLWDRKQLRDHLTAVHGSEIIPDIYLIQMNMIKCPECLKYFSVIGSGLYAHAKLAHSDQAEDIKHYFKTKSAAIYSSTPSNNSTDLPEEQLNSVNVRKSNRRKDAEDNIRDKVSVDDASFQSKIAKFIEKAVVYEKNTCSSTIISILSTEDIYDEFKKSQCIPLQNDQSLHTVEYDHDLHHITITWEIFLESLKLKYQIYETDSLDYDVKIISTIIQEISQYFQDCHDSAVQMTSRSKFEFPCADTLWEATSNFALRLIQLSSVSWCSFYQSLNFTEKLFFFETFVDALAFANLNLTIDEGSMIKFVREVLLDDSFQLCLHLKDLSSIRFSWTLSLLSRSKSLVSLLDLQGFSEMALACLHRLAQMIPAGYSISFPHLRNKHAVLLDKSSISNMLSELRHSNDISILERDIDCSKGEELVFWLQQAVDLIERIDPLHLWGANISKSIALKALKLSASLKHYIFMNKILAKLFASVYSKYQHFASSDMSHSLEVAQLTLSILEEANLDDKTFCTESVIYLVTATWLLSFVRCDMLVLTEYSKLLVKLSWLKIIPLKQCRDYLNSMLADLSNKIRHNSTNAVILKALLPLVSDIEFSDSVFDLTASQLLSLTSSLKSPISSSLDCSAESQLSYLSSVYSLLILHPSTQADGGDISSELAVACYSEYSRSQLYFIDGGNLAQAIRVNLTSILLGVSNNLSSVSLLKSYINALSSIYHDIYGLPFLIIDAQPEKESLRLEISECDLPSIYNFMIYRDMTGALGKGELRSIYNAIYKQPIIKKTIDNMSHYAIDNYLFSQHRSPASILIESMTASDVYSRVGEDEVKTFSDVYRRFFWEIAKIGISESLSIAPDSDDKLCKVRILHQKVLPVVHTLLTDIRFNPGRVEAWTRLLKELTDMYLALQDCLGEQYLVTQIPISVHEKDPSIPLKSCISDVEDCGSEETMALLCRRKNALLELIERVFDGFQQALVASPYSLDNAQDLLSAYFEGMGNLYYNNSLQFPKTSIERRSQVLKALAHFSEAASRMASYGQATYSYIMMAKLSWQLDKNIELAFNYFDAAVQQEALLSINKKLKAVLIYQLHSTRIKVALKLAVSENLEKIISELSFLERLTFIPRVAKANNHQGRIAAVIEDAFCALRDCRRLDPFDFKSIYRIAKALHEMHSIQSFLKISLSGVVEFNSLSALDEITKLFDKKRPQIVAIWCLEATTSRFEQIYQRTYKFDYIRTKYISFYLELLIEASNVEKVAELFIWTVSVKHITAAVEAIVSLILDKLLGLIILELTKQENQVSNQDSSNLLLLLFEVYLKVTRSNFNEEAICRSIESTMLLVFNPSLLGEESQFIQVSFSLIKEYCSKRWPEEHFKSKSTVRLNDVTAVTNFITLPKLSIDPPKCVRLTKRQRSSACLRDNILSQTTECDILPALVTDTEAIEEIESDFNNDQKKLRI